MFKNIAVTIGCLIIWGFIGGFDWLIDSAECIKMDSNLFHQLEVVENTVVNLSDELAAKEIVIDSYKKEILDWTFKYNNINEQLDVAKLRYNTIKEQLDLTKHSLNMANEALNSITNENINDSSDYE